MKDSSRLRLALALAVLAGVLCFCATTNALLNGLGVARHAYYSAIMEPVWGKQPENLTFSFDTCGSRAGPYFEPYVESMNWLAEDTLHLLIAVPDNCAANGWLGNYQIDHGDQLVLKYITIRMSGEDACICRAELEFQISDLERRDYSIDIQHVGIILPGGYHPLE